ncbi:unnamed protein product [Arctogadus glacialis]
MPGSSSFISQQQSMLVSSVPWLLQQALKWTKQQQPQQTIHLECNNSNRATGNTVQTSGPPIKGEKGLHTALPLLVQQSEQQVSIRHSL